MNVRLSFVLALLVANLLPASAAMLTVRTNGLGTVSPNLSGKDLEIGKIYTITAQPGRGYVFSNWSGSILTPVQRLTFIMQENLILEANFVPNPFIPRAGRFTGLFFDTNNLSQDNTGLFTLSLSSRGSYSGYILISTNRMPFTGRFDIAGASTPVFRNGAPLFMALSMDVSTNGDGIVGILTNGTAGAVLAASRAGFNSHLRATNFAGKYTLVLPGPDIGNNQAPAGAGFASAVVSKSGRLTLKGSLADGSGVRVSVSLDRNGQWPFFFSLNGGTEKLLGFVTLTELTDSDLSGTLLWLNTAQPRRPLYPLGFTNFVSVIGARYVPPGHNERILAVTNAVLSVSGGNLPFITTNLFALRSDNRIIDAGINRLSLSFTRSTGIFRGHIQPPGVLLPLTFQGALLQKLAAGAGYFLTTNLSGSVIISNLGPPPGTLETAFAVSATNAVPGQPIQFDALFNEAVSSSFWDFGDGTVLTNILSAAHSYATNGDYTVSLTGFNFTAPSGVSASTVIHISDAFTNSVPGAAY